jgi:hypothetical protein
MYSKCFLVDVSGISNIPHILFIFVTNNVAFFMIPPPYVVLAGETMPDGEMILAAFER